MAAIETHGLTKRYGETRAVGDLTLAVAAGEIYGFLGPNGAGKSTTIAMLVDHVRPTRGRATVLGYETSATPLAIRREIGLVAQDAALPTRPTARQQLAFASRAHGAKDSPQVHLDRVGLGDASDRRVGRFSTGMRQRLRLALALVGDPSVLLLDEPASGLDPSGQRWLQDLLRTERERGTAVFVSSHRLDHIEAVSDRVGILVDGRLRAEGPPDELAGAEPETIVVRLPAWRATWGRTIRTMEGVSSLHHRSEATGDHRLTVTLSDRDARPHVLEALPDCASTEIPGVEADGSGLERTYERLAGGAPCAE